MPFRRVKTAIAVGAATVAMVATASALSAGVAGAQGPPGGTNVPGSDAAVGTYTVGLPYSSGQNINVVVPANDTLTPGLNVNILECAAPGGVDPTTPSACDGSTIQGPSLQVNSDGSLNLQTETGTLYTVYALPDTYSLGESPTGQPVCNATNECVLYIGQDQNDFTQPHFWSEPFYVEPNATDSGATPGSGGTVQIGYTLPSGAVDSEYSGSLQSMDAVGHVTFALTGGSLPPGLRMLPSTTAGDENISGKPTEAGTYTFTVTATDSARPTHQTGSQTMTITVDPGSPTLTLTASPVSPSTTTGKVADYGARVVLTARVTGTATGTADTGTISFDSDGSPVADCTLNTSHANESICTATTDGLGAVGTHTLTASVAADANYNAASSNSVSYQVQASSLRLSVSNSSTTVSQSTGSFNSTVTVTPAAAPTSAAEIAELESQPVVLTDSINPDCATTPGNCVIGEGTLSEQQVVVGGITRNVFETTITVSGSSMPTIGRNEPFYAIYNINSSGAANDTNFGTGLDTSKITVTS